MMMTMFVAMRIKMMIIIAGWPKKIMVSFSLSHYLPPSPHKTA